MCVAYELLMHGAHYLEVANNDGSRTKLNAIILKIQPERARLMVVAEELEEESRCLRAATRSAIDDIAEMATRPPWAPPGKKIREGWARAGASPTA